MRSIDSGVLRWGMIIGLLARESHAQETFAFSSPPTCPQRREFVARVSSRQAERATQNLDAALNALLSQVVVETSPTRGALHFRNGSRKPRQVTANTCDEVVTGLALIAGLALDEPTILPNAGVPDDTTAPDRVANDDAASTAGAGSGTTANASVPDAGGSDAGRSAAGGSAANSGSLASNVEGRSAASGGNRAAGNSRSIALGPSPEAATAPRTTVTTAPRVEAPSAASGTRSGSSAPPRAATSLTSDSVAERERPRRDVRNDASTAAAFGDVQDSALVVGLGAAGALSTALERPDPRVDAFFELSNLRQTWAARLAGFAAWGDASQLSWNADWRVYGGRVEGCPFVLGRGWHVAACALASVGSISVQSNSTIGDAVEDAQLLWADAGAGLRLGSPAVWGVNLEAQFDAVVPITRYQFSFEAPSATLVNVPTVAMMLRLGFRLQPGAN